VPEFHLPPVPKVAIPVAKPWKWRVLGVAAAGFVCLGFVAWTKQWTSPPPLDGFWQPILDSSNPVLLCVGQPQGLASTPGVQPDALPPEYTVPVTVQDLHRLGNQHIALADATTLSRIAGLLQSRGKAYHIRGRSTTTLSDLRDGPVVLIGAFNNDWTLRLTGGQRFRFDRDLSTQVSWIVDQQNPSNRDWRVDFQMPYVKLNEDYAIVSRVLDPTLDRVVVVAAGITKFGTIAAGEFLTDPTYMATVAKQAPAGWQRKNFEAVIAAKVINGSSGPPRLVTAHFW
jgi:hypothetical protein